MLAWQKIDWDNPSTWPPFNTAVDIHDPIYGDGMAVFICWNIPKLPGGGLFIKHMTVVHDDYGTIILRETHMSDGEDGRHPRPSHFRLRELFTDR